MAQRPPSCSPLEAYCVEPTALFTLPEQDFLRLIYQNFEDEIGHLKDAYSIRSSSVNTPSTPSPSQILLGSDYDEVNRTMVGVLALRWIHNGQYEAFVGTQPAAIKLSYQSFTWIRNLYQELVEQGGLFALIVSIVINDLGKQPLLAQDYFSITGQDISSLNHDLILLKAIRVGLIGCLDRLSCDDKTDVLRGLELGATLNFGQLAQAENSPASLSRLSNMKGYRRAFDLHFMEQILDVAGASGHLDWTCAQKLIQPIFDAYAVGYASCTSIISGQLTPRRGYDHVLTQRASVLREQGFRELNVRAPEDRALMRLLCMGGVIDLPIAQLYETAWESLGVASQLPLLRALNNDGSMTMPAVQPTYAPALLSYALASIEQGEQAKRQELLTEIFRYLSRVMSLTGPPDVDLSPVVERSVLWVVKDYVETGLLQDDPGILRSLEVR
ncbi:hypothetical protein BJX99DRAFT_261915 [Aspergillus californicus]